MVSALEQLPKSIPILMYHCVADPRFREFVTSPDTFRSQLVYLQQEGYTPIGMTDWVEMQRNPGEASSCKIPARPIILTFDDAFVDFYTNAAPIMASFGFRSVLYVPTAFTGQSSRWLAAIHEGQRAICSWEQLRELAAQNVEIGSHTHSHQPLDMLPKALAKREVELPKRLLEDRLGIPITSFSYPFGYFSQPVREMVRRADYSSACSVRELMSGPDDDVFAMARLAVRSGISHDDFAAQLQRSRSLSTIMVRKVKDKAWYWYRRFIRRDQIPDLEPELKIGSQE